MPRYKGKQKQTNAKPKTQTQTQTQQIYQQHGVSEDDQKLIMNMQSMLKSMPSTNKSGAKAVKPGSNMALFMGAGNNTQSITLPIFPGATIISHVKMPLPIDYSGDGNKTVMLPVASLISKENFASVLAYYQKQLPKFAILKSDTGRTILLEQVPNNFDVNDDVDKLASIPHVAISKASKSAAAPGAKTLIQIAYKEE